MRAADLTTCSNLVCNPAFLVIASERVASNKGARSAGVDGKTVASIEKSIGVNAFLEGLRSGLREQSFSPSPVREKMIPKANGKFRRLGIPTVEDRVVQAALKLVLEPIFEADFRPCSYGFRPKRRAHNAVAEIHFLAKHSYEWVLEADIEACFDNISHSFLLERMRRRVGDKRVLRLVKQFLKAGILTELGRSTDTYTGTPQGGILSPLLANIALSALDDHFAEEYRRVMATTYQRRRRRSNGLGSGGCVGTPTTSSLWSPGPALMLRRCVRWWRRCWPRSGCACQKRKPRCVTSTRGSTSSGSVSSGNVNEEVISASFIPSSRISPSLPSGGR